jgi:leucyl-tRNA synthetase
VDDGAAAGPSAYAGDDPDVVADKKDGGFVHQPSGRKLEAQFLVDKQVVWRDGRPHHPELGVALLPVAEKMSKARGNVVNPDDVVREFGADSLRLYEMFMGPLEQVKPWQTAGIQGVRRFLDRVDAASRRAADVPLAAETEKQLHRTLKKVTEDVVALRFNTAVSTMMTYVNHLTSLREVPRAAVLPFLVALCPFAPHLAEALFADLSASRGLPEADGTEGAERAPCLSLAAWPTWDERLCVDDVITVPVQVNGKVRSRVDLPRDAGEADARAQALAAEGMDRQLEGKTIKKFIYVPGRICNFIVG